MHKDRSFAWLDRSLDVHELHFHRLANRQLIVHLFRRYLAGAIERSLSSFEITGSICIVGSVARGEFDVENSDVDLWFLDIDAATRNEILKAIAHEFMAVDIGLSREDLNLILSNEGKTQQRDWEKYPCLGEVDFHTSGLRRAQVLFETVAVHNNERHVQLQKVALRAAGVVFRGRDVRQNPQKIYSDIRTYATAVEKRKYINAVDFAKQLVSRRLGQHLMRLSVLEAIFRKKVVTESADPDSRFIEILQTPTASKALFWASTEFLHGKMMTRISEREFKTLHRNLRQLVRGVDIWFPGTGDPRGCVGRLAILVTREYSSALNLLHSPSLRIVLSNIDDFVLAQHARDPNIDQLITTARRFIHTCTVLVKALELTFRSYDAARLFSRPYPRSGLEIAITETLKGLSDDPLANDH